MSKSKRSNSGDVDYDVGLWHPADERLDSSAWRPMFEKMTAAAEKAADSVWAVNLPSRTQLEGFLEADERLLAKLAEAIDRRPRKEIAAILQAHLNNLAGKSLGMEGNRLWASMFREFLLATGLRVACIGPACAEKELPSVLQYKVTQDRIGKERIVFTTEHYAEDFSKIRRHGGRNEIPSLKLISFFPDLSFWRDRLGRNADAQARRRFSRTRGRKEQED